MINKRLVLIMVALGLTFVIGSLSPAAADNFFKDKTIRFIVGNAPGGGYDTYTRMTARFISKHIPGNPTPIVQNRPGGGGLITANYIYNRAKPDGLTVGIWNGGLIVQQVLGSKSVKFEADKFGWLGAPGIGLPICAIMGFTGLKTLDDVINSKRPLKFGATRAGTTTGDFPKILKETLGANIRVIAGYGGSATIRLAMQRREVDGVCITWDSMRVTGRAMLAAKGDDRMIPFVMNGETDDAEVKDVPRITKVLAGKKGLAIFNAWGHQYQFQRPLSLPPGVPKDRLNTLRRAYKATLEDPEFKAAAKKSRLLISYVPWEKLEKYVADILATPPEAKKKLRFLVPGKKKR